MTKFGKRLRGIRQQAEMTLKELSDGLGWTVVYLSDIERGRRNPPAAEKIVEMGRILGTGTQELLELAAKAKESVTLSVKDKSPMVEEAALVLARQWAEIGDKEAGKIVKILGGKKAKRNG